MNNKATGVFGRTQAELDAINAGEHRTDPKPRGFAAMDRWTLSEIARKGGKAAHAMGVGHEFSHEEAVAAARKGVAARRRKREAAQAK